MFFFNSTYNKCQKLVMFTVFVFVRFFQFSVLAFSQNIKKCVNVSAGKHYYLRDSERDRDRVRGNTPQYVAALYVCLVRDTFCDSSRQNK